MCTQVLPMAWKSGILVLLHSLILLISANVSAQEQRLLEQPAIISTMASHSVMLSVCRAGDRLVAVGERGFILLSEDNGSSWQQVASPVSVTLTKVRFVDSLQGWAVGHAGVVLHSGDGGLTWVKQFDGIQAAKTELQGAEQDAAADASAANTEHVEQARQLLEDGPDKPFLDLLFSDPQHGLIVGAYGLAFSTQDGGASWQSIRSRIDNPSGMHLYSLQRVGGQLFLAGEQGTLLRSSDGGRHFNSLTSPYSGTHFGMSVGLNDSLVIFGLRGKAYRSVDLGQSWQALDTLQPVTLTASTRLEDGSVLLADESGRLLRFAARQTTASQLTVAEPVYSTGLAQAADGRVVVSSTRGMVTTAIDIEQPEQ